MNEIRLLVIEDELEDPIEDNLFIVILKAKGYNIDIAQSGTQACNLLRKKRFDIVCLDIMLVARMEGEEQILPENMPRMEVGVCILEKLNSGEFEPAGTVRGTPVIVVSGVTGFERTERIRNLVKEEEYYQKKPIAPETIVNLIEKALTLEEKRAGKSASNDQIRLKDKI